MSVSLPKRLGGALGLLLVALSAAMVLAGCGGGSGSTAATSQTQTPARSGPTIVAAGKTATGGGDAKGTGAKRARDTGAPRATSSDASHVPAAARKTSTPASIHHAAPPSDVRLLRHFAGSGDTRLGTIVVSSAEELVWQASRSPIQIFAANGFMLVNSQAPTGSIHLSQGTYRGVRVATHASWSIELRRSS